MASCKRHVYQTMCEKADGQRTGRYGGTRFESVPKPGAVRKKAATTRAAPKRKAVPRKSTVKEVFAHAYFKRIGKEVTTKEEFVMTVSLDLKWMSPSRGKAVLKGLLDDGVLIQRGDFIRPSPAVADAKVPTGYKPPKSIVEG